MSERRKQARKATNDYFMVYDRRTNHLVGRVLDLTPDGAMMISETPVPEQVTIECKMHMPRMIGRRRYVYFDAACKWCRKNRRLGWYETGYALLNVSPEDQELIDYLIGEWSEKTQAVPIPVILENPASPKTEPAPQTSEVPIP
jgi:hypothetical protein